eukprot:148701_1
MSGLGIFGGIVGALLVIGFCLPLCRCMCRRGDCECVCCATDRDPVNIINNNKDNKSNEPNELTGEQKIQQLPIQIKLQTDLNFPQTTTSTQEEVPNDTPQSNDEELPPGWITCETEDGQIYYQNNVTEETQWEKPIV